MNKLLDGETAVAKKHDKPDLISVKIEADVYRTVRTVAAWMGVNVSEYLSSIARGPADRDFARMKASKSNGHKQEHDE